VNERTGAAAGIALDRVVGDLPEGILVADAAGRIRYANPGALRLLGYARGE